MTITVRRLEPGDESVVMRLEAEAADFGLENEEQAEPTDFETAQRYLSHSAVFYWVAFAEDDTPVGSLYCVLVPLSTLHAGEMLLYEVGVHWRWRRQGIGRMLLAAMEGWMREHGLSEVWVLADNPGAVGFYQACGFNTYAGQSVYMTRTLE